MKTIKIYFYEFDKFNNHPLIENIEEMYVGVDDSTKEEYYTSNIDAVKLNDSCECYTESTLNKLEECNGMFYMASKKSSKKEFVKKIKDYYDKKIMHYNELKKCLDILEFKTIE